MRHAKRQGRKVGEEFVKGGLIMSMSIPECGTRDRSERDAWHDIRGDCMEYMGILKGKKRMKNKRINSN